MWAWLIENPIFIFGPITAFASISAYINQLLKDTDHRQWLVKWLSEPLVWPNYRSGILSVLARLDHFFGASLWSSHALGRCLQLAYAYPFLFFTVAWVSGGPGQLGSIRIFEDDLGLTTRFMVLGFFIVLFLYFYWLIKHGVPSIEGKISQRFFKVTSNQALATISLIAVAVAGAFAGAGAGAGAIIDYTIILFLFLFLLPVSNAFLDWVSWAASRFFIRKAVENETLQRFYLMGHLLLDSLLAVIFLMGLAILLPVLVQTLNSLLSLSGSEYFVSWLPLLDAAKEAPWTKGLTVTGMLFTTLIPTVLHLSIGFVAIITPFTFSRWRKRVVDNLKLPNKKFTDGKGALVSLYLCTTFFVGLVFAMGVIYLLILVINLLADTDLMSVVGNGLYDLAIWSANLIGGPGLPSGES